MIIAEFYRQNKILLSWFMVVVWMVIIFLLSSQPATDSSKLSSSVTSSIIKGAQQFNIITKDKDVKKESKKIRILEPKIRDTAHATVFFFLGLLVMFAFHNIGLKGLSLIVYSYALCSTYAWTDEVHQCFVSGRSTEFLDLSLDYLGAILGIGLFFAIYSIKKKKLLEAK